MKISRKLSLYEKEHLENPIVEISGQSMSRTALGIVKGLMMLNPNATFAELKKMLPDTLNPSAPNRYKSIFTPFTTRPYGVIQPGSIRAESAAEGYDINHSHFTADDEIIYTADGIEVLVSKSWESKDTITANNDLQALIDHVKQYNVFVIAFEAAAPFKKGSYTIDLIEPNKKDEDEDDSNNDLGKKEMSLDSLASLPTGIKIFAIIIFFVFPGHLTCICKTLHPICECPTFHTEEEKKEIVPNKDTCNFNTEVAKVNFEKGKYALNQKSNRTLDSLVGCLQTDSLLHITIEGHASLEGKPDKNKKLSAQRAKAAAEYMLRQNIAASRIRDTGLGTSAPIIKNATTEAARAFNRRLTFKKRTVDSF